MTDASGAPVARATVMVYSAGVRTGYSTFCPTCYVDCGKHAFTDSEGNFTIAGLSPELVFNLLVIKNSFAATWVKKVDPAKGPAETAALKHGYRPPIRRNLCAAALSMGMAIQCLTR